jgi:methyl-accepting chemotaxis protein
MKLKFLPWVLMVAALVCLGVVYNSNQQQVAELAQARQELEQLRANPNETNQSGNASENDELGRLREENKDVLRLRNEVRQLRDENKQLKGQAQAAQAQVQTVQAQAEQLKASAAQATAQAQQFEASARMQSQINNCINNLRMLDGAIQQWALENNKPQGSRVTMADIDPYLKAKPVTCPASGIYALHNVGTPPTCSIPGHVLPKTQ